MSSIPGDREKRMSICRHKSFILLEIQLFWRQMQYKMNESTKTTFTFFHFEKEKKKATNERMQFVFLHLRSDQEWRRIVMFLLLTLVWIYFFLFILNYLHKNFIFAHIRFVWIAESVSGLCI